MKEKREEGEERRKGEKGAGDVYKAIAIQMELRIQEIFSLST